MATACIGASWTAEIDTYVNSQQIHVSRTSIPLDSETKERLSEVKRDDETWDEFLLRIVSETGGGMSPGTLSEEEAENAMEIVRDGRER